MVKVFSNSDLGNLKFLRLQSYDMLGT